jgi:hypothetical protein
MTRETPPWMEGYVEKCMLFACQVHSYLLVFLIPVSQAKTGKFRVSKNVTLPRLMLFYGPCIYPNTTLKIKVMLQIYFSCVPVHADNLCNLKSRKSIFKISC